MGDSDTPRPAASIDQLTLGDTVSDLFVRVISPAISVGADPKAAAGSAKGKGKSKSSAGSKRKATTAAVAEAKGGGTAAAASTATAAADDADAEMAEAMRSQAPALVSRIEDRSGFCVLSVALGPAPGRGGSGSSNDGYASRAAVTKLLQPNKKLKVSGSVAAAPNGQLQIRVDSGPTGNGGRVVGVSEAAWRRHVDGDAADGAADGDDEAGGRVEPHPPIASEAELALALRLRRDGPSAAAATAAAEGKAPVVKVVVNGGDLDVSGVSRMYGSILVRKKPHTSFLEFLLVTDPDTDEWRFPAEYPLANSAETERECAYRSVPLDQFVLLQTPPLVEYTRRRLPPKPKTDAKDDAEDSGGDDEPPNPRAPAADPAQALRDGVIQTHYYVAVLNAEYDLAGDQDTQWCTIWSGGKFLYADQMRTLRAAHRLCEERAALGLLFSADPVPLQLNPNTDVFSTPTTATAGDGVGAAAVAMTTSKLIDLSAPATASPASAVASTKAASAAAPAAAEVKREGGAILMQTPLPDSKKLPVTILSGFLGSGKTTLLQRLLHNSQGMRIAVIVNDMAEVNIDAKLVLNSSTTSTNTTGNTGGSDSKALAVGTGVLPPKATADAAAAAAPSTTAGGVKMVELSNGCICCTLREDLLTQIVELARAQRYQYLVIESSGISEPQQIAEVFEFTDAAGHSLSDFARLDTTVTVLDAYHFFGDLLSGDTMSSADSRLAALTRVQTDKHSRITADLTRTGKLDVATRISASKFAPPAANGTNANGTANGSGKKPPSITSKALMAAMQIDTKTLAASPAGGGGDGGASEQKFAVDPDCPDGTCPDQLTPEARAALVAAAEQNKPLAELLVDQIEFADVIVVNKCDLMPDAGVTAGAAAAADGDTVPAVKMTAELKRIEQCLTLLNRTATVVYTSRGRVAPQTLLNTRKFDLEKARESAGWLSELRGTHHPESSEYGITSFVYRAKRPFHPQRLMSLLTRDPKRMISSGASTGGHVHSHATVTPAPTALAAAAPAGKSKASKATPKAAVTSKAASPAAATSTTTTTTPAVATTAAGGGGADPFAPVLRSKGFMWLATNHTHFGVWAQAGRVFQFATGGVWWAVTPERMWPRDDPDFAAQVLPRMDAQWGDRAQEIVFIGSSANTSPAAANGHAHSHPHSATANHSGNPKWWHQPLRDALDSALLTDSELALSPDSEWRAFPDPFERCGWSATADRASFVAQQKADAEEDGDEDEDEDDDGGEGEGEDDGDEDDDGDDDAAPEDDESAPPAARNGKSKSSSKASPFPAAATVPAFISAARQRRAAAAAGDADAAVVTGPQPYSSRRSGGGAKPKANGKARR